MNSIECELCVRRKTVYCPNSSECYDTADKPFYQNRITLLEENKALKQCIMTDHHKIHKLSDIIDEAIKTIEEQIEGIKEYDINRKIYTGEAIIDGLNVILNELKKGDDNEKE